MQNIGRPFAGPLITPYWFHAFCEFLIDTLPNMFVVNYLLSHHHAVRKHYLKKSKRKIKQFYKVTESKARRRGEISKKCRPQYFTNGKIS